MEDGNTSHKDTIPLPLVFVVIHSSIALHGSETIQPKNTGKKHNIIINMWKKINYLVRNSSCSPLNLPSTDQVNHKFIVTVKAYLYLPMFQYRHVFSYFLMLLSSWTNSRLYQAFSLYVASQKLNLANWMLFQNPEQHLRNFSTKHLPSLSYTMPVA